jgi:UrcA family protein
MSRFIKLLPLTAALAISSIAGASISTLDSHSVVVRYDAKALATRAGVASLHARIRNAAQVVCSPLESRVLGLRQQYESCVSGAISQTVASINDPNLSRFHRDGAKAVQQVASSSS